MILIKREGFPEEGDLVWCTVTKIQFHSVFCKLEEYDKQGMIHISEVSPGRIRNIRDYVKEGKPVVCKILKISKEKGHIDLSLRRVSEGQKRKKANQIKHEKKAEKIVEATAKRIKSTPEKIVNGIKPLLQTYDYYFAAFEDVVDNNTKLKDFGIDEKLATELEKVIREKIKPKEVTITGKLTLKTYDEEGVNKIKKILEEMSFDQNITITYAGGGSYRTQITSKDYKTAESILKKMLEIKEKKFVGESNFSRDKQ